METATQRRLYEELGIRCPLQFLFKFQYQAQFDATGAENELCSVFIGRCREPIRANSDEILDWRWISPEALQTANCRAGRPDVYPLVHAGMGPNLARPPAGGAGNIGAMAIPLLQMYKVARYIAGRKLRGDKRYPLVLMLEPLFQCNLACSGCGKIDYPKEILQKRVGVEDALRAVDECGAPIVSIPGGEPLIHKEMPQIVAGIVARQEIRLPVHQRHSACPSTSTNTRPRPI